MSTTFSTTTTIEQQSHQATVASDKSAPSSKKPVMTKLLASKSAAPSVSVEVSTPPPPAPRARLNSCDLLISVLECYMMEHIRRNERLERADAMLRLRRGRPEPEPSMFHALQPPSITPVEYLRRLARYSFCSRSVFVAAFCFLDRIANMRGVGWLINSLSVHRLVLTAVLIATKVIDDVLYDNAHFAKVGGLDVKELNMLELHMLKILDFRAYISAEDFEAFETRVLETAFATRDPDYSMLPARLRNLGYLSESMGPALRVKAEPASPTSSMDVSFVAE